MNLNNLDYEFKRREPAMSTHHELINEALLDSMGTPDTMSAEDMKKAIVSLWRVTQFQEQLIEQLYTHLTEVKKPWYKRIFKK
jgi:hypothetical protein